MITNEPSSSDLRRRIFQIQRLAALPSVIWQLMDALSDERSTAGTLGDIIESDLALASKVLSLANSAYYGLPRKITTISRAVVVIGFQELEFLALGAGLADFFDPKSMPPDYDGESLWVHSLAVSCTARDLAEAAGYESPSEIMVAGLLHDLGKLVLAAHLQKELDMIMVKVRQGMSFYRAEEELELKHSQIGYWLSTRWGLPLLHTTVIRDHHQPVPTDPYYIPTCLVALADHVTKRLGFGLIQESRALDLGEILRATGLNQDKIKRVAVQNREKIPRLLENWINMLNRGKL
jgi:HD-like signal output (HDOD) protein